MAINPNAYLVLRKRDDGKHGLLNIVEGTTSDHHAHAVKLMTAWQATMPEATLTIKLGVADKCKDVNNHSGFV